MMHYDMFVALVSSVCLTQDGSTPHVHIHHTQCFPQVENKALTKLAEGQHACHRHALLGEEYERGCRPSGRGVWGGLPPKVF